MNETIKTLESKRDNLYNRLWNGADRIDIATAEGRNVREWESLWLSLLSEYEMICAQLAALNVAEVQKAQHHIAVLQG